MSLSSIVAAAGPTITFACARSLLLAFTLNVAALLAAAEDAERRAYAPGHSGSRANTGAAAHAVLLPLFVALAGPLFD